MPPYMVSVLKAADTVPADKREDFLRTVEAIARMHEKQCISADRSTLHSRRIHPAGSVCTSLPS